MPLAHSPSSSATSAAAAMPAAVSPSPTPPSALSLSRPPSPSLQDRPAQPATPAAPSSAADNPLASLLKRVRARTVAQSHAQAHPPSITTQPARVPGHNSVPVPSSSSPSSGPRVSHPESTSARVAHPISLPLTEATSSATHTTSPHTLNLTTCSTAVPEPDTILLPYLERPQELEELLLSPASPPHTREVMRRVQALFASAPTVARHDDRPSGGAAPNDAYAGEDERSLFLAVLLAPRAVLPDARWVAGMYALIFSHDAELWAKFSAIVGADIDRSEWSGALRSILAEYGEGESSRHNNSGHYDASQGLRAEADNSVAVLLRAGMTLAQAVRDHKDNTHGGTDATTPSAGPVSSVQSSPHSPPFFPRHRSLSDRRDWSHTLTLPHTVMPTSPCSPIRSPRRSPHGLDSTKMDRKRTEIGPPTSPGVGVEMGVGLSPGKGGCVLLPVGGHAQETPFIPPGPAPEFSFSPTTGSAGVGGGCGSSPSSPTSRRARRSRPHSRGSSLASPGLGDLREEPEPLEAAPLLNSSSETNTGNLIQNKAPLVDTVGVKGRSLSQARHNPHPRNRRHRKPNSGKSGTVSKKREHTSLDDLVGLPNQHRGGKGTVSAPARPRTQTYSSTLSSEAWTDESSSSTSVSDERPDQPAIMTSGGTLNNTTMPTSWRDHTARAQMDKWRHERLRRQAGNSEPKVDVSYSFQPWTEATTGTESESDPGQTGTSSDKNELMEEVSPDEDVAAAHSDPGEKESEHSQYARPWQVGPRSCSPIIPPNLRHMSRSKSSTLALARGRYLPHGSGSPCPHLPAWLPSPESEPRDH